MGAFLADLLVKEGTTPLLFTITYWFLFTQLVFLITGLVFYQLPLWRRWWPLFKATHAVQKAASKSGDLTPGCQELESKIFQKEKWARTLFLSFVRSWNDSRPPDSDRSSVEVRFADYFNFQDVIAKASNQRMAEVLPGLYLAFGIFGTFLGLVLGLQKIQITQASVDQINNGITVLISGLSLAFLTSLLGIASSVLFSWTHKIVVRALGRRIDILEESISALYPYETSSLYFRRFLELQGDIKGQLQGLATDIATAMTDVIGPAMGEAVSTHLAPVVDEMKQMLSQHIDRTDSQHTEAVEGMLQKYVEILQGNFRDQMEDMAELIRNTSQAQENIQKGMQGFSEHMERHIVGQADLVEKTGKAAQLISDSLDGMERVSQSLSTTASQVTEMTETMHSSIKQTTQTQSELRDIIESQVEALNQTREDLESAWESIQSGLTEASKSISEMAETMGRTTGEHLQRALAAVDNTLGEIVNRFSGTILESKEAIEELPGFMGDLSGSMDAVATRVSELGELVEKFEETSRNTVIPNMEVVQESAISLATSVNDSSQLLTDMKQMVDSLDGRLKGSVVEMREFLEGDFLSHLKESTNGDAVAQIFQQAHSDMAEVVGHIHRKIDSLDEKASDIAQAINDVASIGDRLEPDPEPKSGGFLSRFKRK